MMLGIVLLLLAQFLRAESSKTPNIIIITADDVGHNDFGFVNQDSKSDVKTPKIDKYAQSSTIFKKYYVHPNGHSSRAALLTGQHPAHLGAQFNVGDATSLYGLNLSFDLLPHYLKEAGYETHAVGQWDLGFFSSNYLPTHRGFKSFYGSYLSYGNYETYLATDKEGHTGHDLHDGESVVKDAKFKPEEMTYQAQKIIEDHDGTKPLFLYVAFQVARIKNAEELCGDEDPQIPRDYLREFNDVQDSTRRCYLALISALDRAYDRIMNSLKDNLLLEDSIVIFTTTSGGAATDPDFNAASNAPFRGSKNTGWEGGVRGVSFVYAPAYKNAFESTCLFHISDWMPTIFKIKADLDDKNAIQPSQQLYGIQQLSCIKGQGPSNRQSIVHFLYGDSASMVTDNYKIMMDLSGHISGMDEWYSGQSSVMISCSDERGTKLGTDCVPKQRPCLFDLRKDPCEKNNIAGLFQDKLNELYEELTQFNKSVDYQIPEKPTTDQQGDPIKHNGVWKPWKNLTSSSTTICLDTVITTVCLLVTLIITIS